MISVITPTYNCADYILRSYECLRSQVYSDWEWIVVNDGSVDHTEQLVCKLRTQDDRVKYHSLAENRGRGYARNYAVSMSRGSVIVVWDVDDLYTSNRLAEIFNAIEAGFDFFCSYALLVDNMYNLKGARHFADRDTRFAPSFVHPTLAFRADLKEVVVYDPNMRAGEDLGVMLNFENNYKGFYCEEYLMVYFEDREVNLRKAFNANLNQYKSTCSAIKSGVVICTAKEQFTYMLKKALKLGLLQLLSFKPSIYIKTVRFRASDHIVSSKLNGEHLAILGGDNAK